MADVAHSTLTGADLHEPKGVASATANKVYVSNGAGSGTWTTVTSSGRWVLISTATPSNAANVTFTGFNSTLYEDYRIVIEDIVPSINREDLCLRISGNGGSSYDSGSSDYAYAHRYLSRSLYTIAGNQGTNRITLATDVRNTDGGLDGVVQMIDPSRASSRTKIQFDGSQLIQSNDLYAHYTWGIRRATAATNAVQILFTGGNISSGVLRFYGLTK